MAKKVVWTSCNRLACACVTPNPSVILCLTDSSLLAPRLCPDDTDMSFPFTTLEATLTKSWKTENICNKTSWSYVFEYDESLLADPTTALTLAQISGVFCEGCLTTWIREEIGDEIQVTLDDEAGTVTITSQHGCETTFSVDGSGPSVDWHILGNVSTVDGTNFCGTIDDVAFDVRTNNKRSRRTEPNEYISTSVGPLDAPNILDGNTVNSIDDAVSATISGGGTYAQAGNANRIAGTGSTSTTIAFGSTISGGAGNRIDPEAPPDFTYMFAGLPVDADDYGGYSTISGGGDNEISWHGEPSSLGAGFHVISGGQSNTIEDAGGCAVIGGGYINFITYALGTLDATEGNQIASDTISGGANNIIDGVIPTSGAIVTDAIGANFIGSGIFNQIDNGWNSTIAGGWTNIVSTVGSAYSIATLDGPLSYNFIGGGGFNSLIGGQASILLGGSQTKILGEFYSGILGGFRNVIYSSTLADPPIVGASSYNITYPSITEGAMNVIAGGIGNYIEDGFCSTILGGAFLALGARSAGYQGASSRTFSFTPGDSATPYNQFNNTNYAQVDLTAFPDIFYVGDVDLWVGNTDNTARKLKLVEPNTDVDYSSAHYTSFQAPVLNQNIEYILPDGPGVVGQYLRISAIAGDQVTLFWSI